MKTHFAPDGLLVPSFPARLAALLDRAREELGVTAIAVADLAAADGQLAPRWRAISPATLELAALAMDQFETLAKTEAGSGNSTPESKLVEATFSNAGVSVTALAVTPRLLSGPDTLLLIAHDERGCDREKLAQLILCLERGLSRARHELLAELTLAAVEQSADAIEITDREARLVYANKAWEQLFRYQRDRVLGQTVGHLFRDAVEPMHDAAFYQFTMGTLLEGKPWLGVLANRTGDGGRLFCEVQVAPFFADDASFRGNVAIRREITNRRERDTALAVAHREFRHVLSSIPEGVAVLRDGKIYFANAALLTTLGRCEGDVIGKPYIDFVHPDDRAQFEHEYELQVTRVRFVPSSGAPRFVEISRAGAVSFEGRPAMILLSRDTTDYRIAQEQLARAEKFSALGSLAAGIAHEINNPLAYVVLNLELIRPTLSDDERHAEREALDEAVDGVQRIRQIVAELHGFSGSDAPGPPEPVDVNKAVTSAINIVQTQFRHRARLERAHEPGLFALAREGQLVQVLVNVLTNAAQAIPTDGEDHLIRVSTWQVDDEAVEISISDTGSGIPESALPHVFEPFYTGKRRGEGSGLGLAISKRIVDDFGGHIRFESTLGRGTTVYVRLPSATPLSGGAREGRRPSMFGAAAPRARILIVDDELPLARTLRRLLADHDVTLMHDGRTARKTLQSDAAFDVILCDVMMPGLSGAQLYQAVCAEHPELAARFIFMTGGNLNDLSSAFREALGPRLLVKPFEPERVLKLVAQTVGRSREGVSEADPGRTKAE
jgi:PAS domain S-box-containing protein